MLKINSKMLRAYSDLSVANVELHYGLKDISDAGFTSKSGCYFLRRYLEVGTNVKLSDFPDKTGYECFINSVNVDDFVEDCYLEQGICFVRNVFAQWNDMNVDNKLIAILSMDEFGLKVKFHIHRFGEDWLTDELEDYEESLMVVDSCEPKFISYGNGG